MTRTLEDLADIEPPNTVQELLARMEIGRKTAEAFINAHDETAMTRPLGESGWSAKDYLVHLMVWERGMVSLIHKTDRLKEMGLDRDSIDLSDFDGMNNIIYRQHLNWTLAEVLQAFRETHQKLVDLLEQLADADIQKPYRLYQPLEADMGDWVENPISGWLVGNTYAHYAEHILDLDRMLSG